MLSVKNLKVTYGRIAAITDVSFEVPEGKIVTLIGANGAGKSTTLRTISGLLRSRTGSIIFKGLDIATMPAEKIDLALRLEADRMVNSAFDEKEFASERTVVISTSKCRVLPASG